MTETQEKLFKLVNEIADICDANDIVYYLAGGSTIGALRHKGFIPWDDDMDIMMTRDNWQKFLAATRKEMPENRTLMCQENSRKYNNMFGRYVDTGSATIHKGDMLGGGAAGFVIDILCLDPIPDMVAYQKYIEDLMLYSDLINPTLNYSLRWNMNKDRYDEYLLRIENEGRDAVLSELEQGMFCYDENACDYLVLRWGGVPFLFDKKMYGSSRWAEFEGRQFRIPDRSGDYLTQHYGDEWAYIPPHDEQFTHKAIFSPDIGYSVIQNDYLPFIDVEEETRKLIMRKKAFFKQMYTENEYRDKCLDVIVKSAKYVVERDVAAADEKLEDLIASKNYRKIMNIFETYYREQGSRDIIGREDFDGIRMFNNPILVDISEDMFYAAVIGLINCNKMSKAARFLDVWEQVKGGLSDRLQEQRSIIMAIRKAISEYDVGNMEFALHETERLYHEYPFNQSLGMMWVRLLYENDRYEELKDECDKLLARYPKEGYIRKYLGDYYRHNNETQKAIETYREALKSTTNGMTILEIHELAQSNSDYKELEKEAI